MKIIKIFEEYISESLSDYYEEIIHSDFHNLCIYERDVLSDIEISTILKDISSKWECDVRSGETDESIYYNYIRIETPFNGKPPFVFDICKSIDDWFCVHKTTPKDEKYYKCDQLKGLLEFLKDNEII